VIAMNNFMNLKKRYEDSERHIISVTIY